MASDVVATIVEQWRSERPDLDPSPIGVIGRLSRVSQHVTADLVSLYRRFDLSEGEFDVLATLRRVGAPHALAPSALVGLTMVTKGAVSKRLDTLEAKGLIAREAAAHDGRGRIVRLTDAGLALIDEAVAAHLQNERRILDALPARDRAELERILTAWARHYESAHPAAP
ncbi:MarR family winged helix-turn-helix transcriptional regulator [Agrococcus baldri]|uniref:MarR family transcriptional regulator n=1 Tax=Agrococcus baldri TaxID=153730 RepID=A0AA87RKW6_9MICO|nr:MarR family transcriptional regulator [Agrococcus baldri]GEK80022.1 MarR family transcriptional regulator [Agrococcus baldri]